MRRNSSKQGLQNLLRVTAQRSVEDAEEIERERRRRARESFRKQESLSGSTGSPQDSVTPPEASPYESDFKPTNPTALDEDEGFSDWTQKLDRRTQAKTDMNGRAEESPDEDKRLLAMSLQKTSLTNSIQHKQTPDREQEVEDVKEKRPARRSSERRMEISKSVSSQRPEEGQDIIEIKGKQEEQKTPLENKMKEARSEVKVSYTSKVFLQQDKMPNGNEEAAVEELTSQLIKTKRSPRRIGMYHTLESKKEMDTGLETEMKLEKIRRSHQEKESQEMEQLRQRQAEAELELEELKKKREERRRFREEEEQRKEEEEQQKLTTKEEEKKQMKEEIERRRMEAAEKRMKNLNVSVTDGDDPFNPLNPKSPTAKITERTESLNRSLKKSNSFKKTQRPVLLPKIDDKLEQYTQAIEISSKEIKMNKAASVDMPCVSAPVASKKNLFEAGEAWNQTTPKGTPTKDTDCVKVGVATLINHWVKGSPEDGNKSSPSTPSDVKPGDVLQKKNMWEVIGEAEKSGLGGKGSSSGKRYKFVVMGHGKYEKISIDGDHYIVYPNGKSSETMSYILHNLF
ncbi:Lymphocyte-specific protein 1 52 kDa phosphoprotein [Triplophysa tibetana]|uniref:Lymphocyte-specific protein 1 52 kDa phosphoprotein n=1 Tax=Triplophysa tibetana TaxID=1572043 RepID=A0A5A9PRG6_9TELE|nr:Lymphocyte-specific protein 1 52 kDa phosphoprotein [Triplophysa tibetana]